MTPISIHRPPAVEHVQSRDSRLDADRTKAAADFASMLAGAVQQKVEKPEPKRPEGTSELDRPGRKEDGRGRRAEEDEADARSRGAERADRPTSSIRPRRSIPSCRRSSRASPHA